MADPMTLALVGAGVGAAMSPNDPIKGAILGGVGGFTGGTALAGSAGAAGAAGAAGGAGSAGAAAAGGAAAAVPTGTGLYASTVPGLAAAGPGSQAAMLAAQTAPMGAAGLTATGASATYAGAGGPLASGFWNAANQVAMGGQTQQGMNALRMAQQMGNQQPRPSTVSPPQMKKGGQVNLAEPIAGLLGEYGPMSVERRRRMSLLG